MQSKILNPVTQGLAHYLRCSKSAFSRRDDVLYANLVKTCIFVYITWPVIVTIFAVGILLLIIWWFSSETYDTFSDERTLDRDGYMVFRTVSRKDIPKHLPPGYVFLNYQYIIRGCSLSTFHRDVTSSPYIHNTIHPVYTYIEYTISDIPLLTVCPGSHTTTPFLYSSPVIISGKGKTGVLFHCDLVHAGALNPIGEMRYAEQYKIAHIDDLHSLSHLQNIRIEKNGQCDISPTYEYISRRISWGFSHIVNHHFTSYLLTRQDTYIGKLLLWLYGREFYNA